MMEDLQETDNVFWYSGEIFVMKKQELGMMKKRILSVKITDLLRDSLKYMKVKCDIDDNSREGTRIYQKCMQIWAKYFAGGQIQLLVGDFGQECIDKKNKRYLLHGKSYTCHLLEQINISAVTGGVLYLFHAPEVDTEGMSQMDCFYVESWQIALMDAVRLWLERYLRRQQSEELYLSEPFGPGFYGMELDAVGAMVKALDGREIGITLLASGMMEPAKSLVGMFLTGTEPFGMASGDCLSCQGTSHCQMCRHYTAQNNTSILGNIV